MIRINHETFIAREPGFRRRQWVTVCADCGYVEWHLTKREAKHRGQHHSAEMGSK